MDLSALLPAVDQAVALDRLRSAGVKKIVVNVHYLADSLEAHLKALGRPTTAFAACELRSPAPFTEQGFYEFNRQYVGTPGQAWICRFRANQGGATDSRRGDGP